MNANDCEIGAYVVPYDGVLVVELLNKAETIINAVKADELLPRGTDDKDGFMCRFCEFKARCWA